MGGIHIDANDFERKFRSTFVDPIKKKLAGIQSNLVQSFLKDITDELPTLLHSWIVSESIYPTKPGALKYLGVIGKLVTWLESKGYGNFAPLLVPVIEDAVRMVFQNTVESIFDKLGITGTLESWLGFTVAKPVTAPSTGTITAPPVTPVVTGETGAKTTP